MPVGFKWFTNGLFDGSYCFGGEESAGAGFLRRDGTVWTTDKDGPVMCLLAAETQTGQDPGKHYRQPTAEFGAPHYTRIDPLATSAQEERLQRLSPDAVQESTLVGESSTAKLTRAPGNNAPIGGLNVIAPQRLVRHAPSGTENLCKVYAESFRSEAHPEATLTDVLKEHHGRSRTDIVHCAVPGGISLLRLASARRLISVPVRDRRSWGRPFRLDRPDARGGKGVVAGSTLRPHGGRHSPYERLSSFVGKRLNPYLPENHLTNTVVYTATHDNATTGAWFLQLPDSEQRRFWNLRRPKAEIRGATPELIRLAWSSAAALAITPFQDLLNLGREGRMNVSANPEGNCAGELRGTCYPPGTSIGWALDKTLEQVGTASISAQKGSSMMNESTVRRG